MDEVKTKIISKIVKILEGLTHYEWQGVKTEIENYFIEETEKLKLDDTEKFTRLLDLEML